MKKILIIDDEKDVITYLDTLFKNNGYDTISADNADDGIEKAKTEKSKRGKALSESGMVRADATCLLKIPPELLTERDSFRRQ